VRALADGNPAIPAFDPRRLIKNNLLLYKSTALYVYYQISRLTNNKEKPFKKIAIFAKLNYHFDR